LEGFADAQRFAVHLEGLLTLVVLDPEVLADGHHLLPHAVARAATAAGAQLAILPAFLSSFCSSSTSHFISSLYWMQISKGSR
jgi:hypothetical protein